MIRIPLYQLLCQSLYKSLSKRRLINFFLLLAVPYCLLEDDYWDCILLTFINYCFEQKHAFLRAQIVWSYFLVNLFFSSFRTTHLVLVLLFGISWVYHCPFYTLCKLLTATMVNIHMYIELIVLLSYCDICFWFCCLTGIGIMLFLSSHFPWIYSAQIEMDYVTWPLMHYRLLKSQACMWLQIHSYCYRTDRMICDKEQLQLRTRMCLLLLQRQVILTNSKTKKIVTKQNKEDDSTFFFFFIFLLGIFRCHKLFYFLSLQNSRYTSLQFVAIAFRVVNALLHYPEVWILNEVASQFSYWNLTFPNWNCTNIRLLSTTNLIILEHRIKRWLRLKKELHTLYQTHFLIKELLPCIVDYASPSDPYSSLPMVNSRLIAYLIE